MKLLTKKGQAGGGVQGIQVFIMAIVGVAVVLAVGLIVIGQLGTSMIPNGVYTPYGANTTFVNSTHYCASGTGWFANGSVGSGCQGGGSLTVIPPEYTANTSILTKLATVPIWLGILITVALAFIVLGYFYYRQ
jgi:hypothetical protein